MYDVIVVGGGPAGLTAAIYVRRANKQVLVLEKGAFGGQITFSPQVENIPGFVSLSGNEFAERLVDQALAQGVEMESAEVVALEREENDCAITVRVEDGTCYKAKALIWATGTRHRSLDVDGASRYVGHGISFCAVCDGAFYRDAVVGVVGGGNSALQEALLLSDLASHVYLFQNLDVLTGEEALQARLRARANVTVRTGVVVDHLDGPDELSSVTLRRIADGACETFSLQGLFVAIGLVPQNEMIASWAPLDAQGYVQTDESCVTPTPGVFVAGDGRRKQIRQVATAVADGAVAALAACRYVDGCGETREE